MVPSQRNQPVLIKGKVNVTVLSVTVPSLNFIVLQGRMERSVLSYLYLPDSDTFPVDIVIKCCNFRGWIIHVWVQHLSWKMWVHGTKRDVRTHLVLEAFPPNIYELLVFILCPKKQLMEVNRWMSFFRQMSKEKWYFDCNTLLGRKGGH